jgi:hypothetical protein
MRDWPNVGEFEEDIRRVSNDLASGRAVVQTRRDHV